MGFYTFFSLSFLIIGMTTENLRHGLAAVVVWAGLGLVAFVTGEIKPERARMKRDIKARE